MAKGDPIASSDVQLRFLELADTASEVNQVSDTAGKLVAEIQDGLISLNLGVTSWIEIQKWTSGLDDRVWKESVGFDKLNKNWCIALRSICEVDYQDEYLEHDIWPFNEAPRPMRMRAIDHLPALLVKMNADAQKLRDDIGKKLGNLTQVAEGVKAAVKMKKWESREKAK